MKTLIEKLENRKKITEQALIELFKLISELEKNLEEFKEFFKYVADMKPIDDMINKLKK